jgi:hypothetical protein
MFNTQTNKQQLNAAPFLKFGVFLLSIIFSIIIAGLYGIVNDQVTYTISPEYFTKFKYIQFGINPKELGGARQTVAAIGFLATWWVGLAIGVSLGLGGLAFKNHKTMFRNVLNALLLTFCITVCTGLAGFLYGKFHLVKTGVDWWLPGNLIDKDRFIIVGSVHNFSYLGGLLGLATGIVYLLLKAVRQSR